MELKKGNDRNWKTGLNPSDQKIRDSSLAILLSKEEEEIYFSKQNHSVQSVVCLNTIISNNKKYYITVLKNMYFKYSDIVNDFT